MSPTTPIALGRTLGVSVAVVAVLNTLSALSLPVPERKPALAIVILWCALLLLHAVWYWLGARLRERFGLRVYAALQAATVFALAVSDLSFPIALGLLMTLTVEIVLLAGSTWGTVPIALGAIALLVVSQVLTSGLDRATTAGHTLVVTAAHAHAVGALVRRPITKRIVSGPALPQPPLANPRANLSVRETEVLQALVRGARNTEIASELGISERTVKSHLAHIYQKLGVETRAAAVAVALDRELTP